MAKFPNMKMTQQGMDMLARAGSGKTEDRLIITHVMLGDGQFDGEIRTLTDVVSPKKEVTLASYLNLGNGKAQCEFIYNNKGIKTGFYHREVGLYGKNGDDGTVKLISYSNAGNYTSYIADDSEIMPYQTLRIGIAIGDNDNVTGLIDVNNALTLEKYYILLDEHNKDSEAHGTAIDKKLKDHDDTENAHEPAFAAKFKAHNEDTDAHKDFVGATAEKEGVRGMVPAPAAGDEGKFLCADGTFKVAKMTTLELVNILYPVGIIAEFTNDTDPNDIWPGTTWSKMDAGRVLVAAGTYTESGQTYTYNLGDKGGEAKHQITIQEMTEHSHAVSISYADLQGSMTNTNNDSLTACVNAGVSGIITKTNGWGHYGGPASSDGVTAGININASHGHNASIGNSGGSGAHENRQPYTVVNRWKRTA